jgi:hypothetical protein
MADRYTATGAEAEFEPGSRRRVLRNLLGIRSVREMEKMESEELLTTTRRAIEETSADQRFTADNIRYLHRAPLDFSGVKGRERQRYFDAVHAAMAGNLAPMMFVFERIVARTQRKQRS